MSGPTELPEPSAEQSAHSARLAGHIRAEIAARGGWISFARFMELALYAPGLGYYSAGAHKLGRAGDFVTAPEVAPLFSRCIARQAAEVLAVLGGGDIVELGAGSGVMAATVLEQLGHDHCLPGRYRMLDRSADLRERQRATLAARVPWFLDRIDWLDALPEAAAGVVLANEVLDAMPVERFVIRGGEVHALGVTWRLGRLEWAEIRAPAPLRDAVRGIEASLGGPLPEGYASELNPGVAPWLAALGQALARGVVILIDYGLPRREYYAAERRMGTLLCHYRHRFHDDPFVRLGLQDIGAWVDFTAVAEAAQAAGFEIAGYSTQAHFLIGAGLTDLVADVADLDPRERLSVSRQARLLTLPGEMGERFKVLALSKGYDAPLRGYSVRDLRHAL